MTIARVAATYRWRFFSASERSFQSLIPSSAHTVYRSFFTNRFAHFEWRGSFYFPSVLVHQIRSSSSANTRSMKRGM